MNRLVFGTGKVASQLRRSDTTLISHKECDITDRSSVEKYIVDIMPDIVINCAAKTNLEYCQENRFEAYNVNTVGPLNILSICAKLGIKYVHISSGCLFDGNDTESYEDSIPTPKVWYTWTKKWADEQITEFGYENYLILRPRQLISAVSYPSNLITKFISMDYIPAIDEINSITCIEDFIDMMNHLIVNDCTGIYNTANSGHITPYDIAIMIKQKIKPDLEVIKTDYEELLEILPNRRVNTLLNIDKLLATGYKGRSAIEALNWCLDKYED